MTEGIQAITTIHLAIMALLAVLAVLAIVAGMRRKRGRVQAQREVEARAHEAGVPPTPPAPADAEPAEPAAPPPASPSPAPVASPEPPPADPGPLADEPIAASVAADGTPATIALDAEGPDTTPSPADGPVTQLKGLGPKVAARLAELGIDRVGQLAALDDAGAAALDAQLGPFAGRLARDRWIEQARLLAAGDRASFERTFGKL